MQVRCGARSSLLASATRRGDDRGVAAVEFAIILPLLVMLVFGIMGFGFTMAQSASLASGARAGARLGAVNGVAAITTGHGCNDAASQARQQAQTIGVSETEVAVTVSRVTAGSAVAICSINAGTASSSGGAPPCTNAAATAATEATVRVTTTVTGQAFTIPVPGASIVTPDTLSKTAEYRCEYH